MNERDAPIRHRRAAWPGPLIVAVIVFVAGPAAGAGPSGAPAADAVHDPLALRALAEAGDKRAAFLLGSRFASGRAGLRDDSEAVRWFRMAAESGLAEAQYNLGVLYASGRGVPQDYAQAAAWYERAAEQGLAEAQFNLGTLHGLGRGVPQDEAVAARWLERAASSGVPEAQYNLGALYEHGRGVPLDRRKALEWYRLAGEQGYEPAKRRSAALAQKLAAPRTEPPAAVAARPEAPAGGHDWLLALDPEHYTMQLASYVREADARRFARRVSAHRPAAVVHATRAGQRWYAVVAGDYPSYALARAAVDGLPEDLRRLKPWVRKVAVIRDAMD